MDIFVIILVQIDNGGMRYMSSLANMLNMYIMLQVSNRRIKIKEMMEYLEVSERSVRAYRDALEQVGIYIDGKAGIYGGYRLTNDNHLLELNITDEELLCLNTLSGELNQSDSIFKNSFNSLRNKIDLAIKNRKEGDLPTIYSLGNRISYGDKLAEKEKLSDIYMAMIKKARLRIHYNSLSSGVRERIIHPYNIFQYKGFMYLIAYCETRRKILEFKVVRIEKYEVLKESFKVEDEYNFKEYVKKSIGIHRGEEYHIELKIAHPMSQIVKETIWVENQEIITYEDKSILFKADIAGKEELITWILGMGDCVEVIKPLDLKKEIYKKIEIMYKNFKPDNI